MFPDMFPDGARLPSQSGTVSPNARGRKVGSTREILAPAKLNLYLEVLGPRADGFHALETLMVPVRIFDQLSWQKTKSNCLTLRVRCLFPGRNGNDQLLGATEENLVLRAARLLAETAGVEPHGQFALMKRIPIQAGMGGGSSDAAAALRLANDVWNIDYSQEQLMSLAAQLGSDVPFFLSRYFSSRPNRNCSDQGCSGQGYGAAICRGRGELVEPVDRLPRLHFVVAKPNAGLSTAEVFGQLPTITESNKQLARLSNLQSSSLPPNSRLSELITTLQSGDLGRSGCWMTNRLETAALRMAPWLAELREAFSQLGCVGHLMTGSGSAYVGVMRSAIQAQRAASLLSSKNLGLSSKNLGLSAKNLGLSAKNWGLSANNMGNVFATSTC